MHQSSIRKKLFKQALYTSPLMAISSFSPFLIRYDTPFRVFQVGVILLSLVILAIWLVNIELYSLAVKGLSHKQLLFWRYVASYSFALGFILFMREVFLVMVSSGYIHMPQVGADTRINNSIPYYGLIMSVSVNSVILIIQDLVTVRENKAMADLENSYLKLKNAEVINQELKQQIHPHFLFNALNTLKTLIHKEPDLAEDYLIRLSNFLRISISATKANTVSLAEELSMCMDYLEMQKTRFGDTLQYSIQIPDEISRSGAVPLFSIQTLLENAIKHNAMYRSSPLCIEVIYEENGWIKVANNKQERETKELSTNSGLDNLSERYRLLSGDQILIRSNENTFSVSIKVL